MTAYDTLVERHVVEHQSRLKHFDELLERAKKGMPGSAAPEVKDELAALEQERQRLVDHIEELKRNTRKEWEEETIEEVGPMILWEAVAKRLELLVERIGR